MLDYATFPVMPSAVRPLLDPESGENRFRLLFFRQSLPQKVGLAMFGEQLGVEAHRPVESDLVMLDLPGGPDDAGVPQGLIC